MPFNLLLNPYALIALFTSITIHEFAHAITADRLGDPTPSLQGRVSLNPIRHLDIYGLFFLLFTGFGWGKPVQFDPYNLSNPRKDAAIISIAGPMSNFLLAIICALLIRLLMLAPSVFIIHIALNLLVFMTWWNVSLGVFNLIPVHPLDGFKIVGGFLPDEQADEWYALERYGFIVLILLVLPIVGGQSMITTFIRPITGFIISVLLPHSQGMI